MMHGNFKLLGLGLGLVAALGTACGDDGSGTGDGSETATPTTGDVDPTGNVSMTGPDTMTSGPSTTDPEPTTTDPEPTTTDPDTTDTEDTGEPGACLGVPESGAAAGEGCAANADCESGICLLYTDAPADDDAVCGDISEDCSTRATGTLFDLLTREPIGNSDVNIIKALDALTGPATAEPVAGGTSAEDGTFDFTSDGPISSPIAIIATAGGSGDYYLTATGVASGDAAGNYEVGTGIHEFWAIPSASLEAWSTAMDGDVDGGLLPLGDAGGIVGFVRDADGLPVAGATVAAAADGSGAVVRYPQADDSVTADMTDERGLFVIMGGAGTGEDYTATAGGMSATGTAGTTGDVVFTLVLTVQ